jgi:hypothetical protein
MESIDRSRRASARTVAVILSATGLLAGCGAKDDYANTPRPAAPIVVSASISSEGISVSPRRFGAGPITLIVTNQTRDAQEITLETDEIGGSAGIRENTGLINPGDTASLKAELGEGTYRVGTGETSIASAALRVGTRRPSAQDDLLQP